MHQSGSGREACLVWDFFFLCTNRRYSHTVTHTHTLADMASSVAVGYQTIKEWDYNGRRPLEEKAKRESEREVKRRRCLWQGRGVLLLN